MKTSCLLALLIGWLFCSCTTQNQPAKPAFYPRQYVVKVRLASQAEAVKGVLYDLTDSVVVLAPIEWTKPEMKTLLKQHGGSLAPTDLALKTYRYADINQLTLHRRGSITKGLLIGAGIGAIGSTIGLLLFPNGFNADFSGSKRQPTITSVQKALGVFNSIGSLGGAGLLIGVATTKRIDTKRQPIAIEIKKRFQDYTIVEQVNRARLYSRYK